MAGYTKGAWTTFDTPLGIGVTATWDVAHCGGFDTNRSRDEEVANARLIAAAPDLLEALKLHDAYMALPTDRGGAFGPKGQARAAFDDAKRAAIAKATGEA